MALQQQQQMAMQQLMLQQPVHMPQSSFYTQNILSPQTAPHLKQEQPSNMFFGPKNQPSANTSMIGSRIIDDSTTNMKK